MDRFSELFLQATYGDKKKAHELRAMLQRDIVDAITGKGIRPDPRQEFRKHMKEIRSQLQNFKKDNGFI